MPVGPLFVLCIGGIREAGCLPRRKNDAQVAEEEQGRFWKQELQGPPDTLLACLERKMKLQKISLIKGRERGKIADMAELLPFFEQTMAKPYEHAARAFP